MSPRVIKDDGEAFDTLNAEELAEVRRILEKQRALDRRRALEDLIEFYPDIKEIIEGKRASVWLWKTIGALAKWVGIVLAAIAAWKTYLANGGVKP